jgi:hypothetical protein
MGIYLDSALKTLSTDIAIFSKNFFDQKKNLKKHKEKFLFFFAFSFFRDLKFLNDSHKYCIDNFYYLSV